MDAVARRAPGWTLVATLLACLGLLPAEQAWAAAAAQIEYGSGQSVEVLGVGLGWDDLRSWQIGSGARLGLALLARVDHWHGQEENPVVANLWDVSLTPVLRLESVRWPVYLDLGVGVHLITETRINQQRDLSTVFQLGELVGPGIRLGKHRQWDVGFRLQHVSNGNIREPNNGLTFHTLVLQYHW